MTDWERLKKLIFDLRAAGDDERLDVEDYADLCMNQIEAAASLIEAMEPPAGASS